MNIKTIISVLAIGAVLALGQNSPPAPKLADRATWTKQDHEAFHKRVQDTAKKGLLQFLDSQEFIDSMAHRLEGILVAQFKVGSADDSVYIIESGKKRLVTDTSVLKSMDIRWPHDLHLIPFETFNLDRIPTGDPIPTPKQ